MAGFTFTLHGAESGMATGIPVTPALEKFQEMALSLMAAHGLASWGFQFDQARRRAGYCAYGRDGAPGTLSFSAPLMELWTQDQQRKIVLHEIAHALAGPNAGHGRAWQLTCIRIGTQPDRTWGHDGEEQLEPKFIGTCPNGHHLYRERAPRDNTKISCPQCSPRYDRRFLFTWAPNPNY
jgi:SprT protein